MWAIGPSDCRGQWDAGGMFATGPINAPPEARPIDSAATVAAAAAIGVAVAAAGVAAAAAAAVVAPNGTHWHPRARGAS